jgi:hypothetical protein
MPTMAKHRFRTSLCFAVLPTGMWGIPNTVGNGIGEGHPWPKKPGSRCDPGCNTTNQLNYM